MDGTWDVTNDSYYGGDVMAYKLDLVGGEYINMRIEKYLKKY